MLIKGLSQSMEFIFLKMDECVGYFQYIIKKQTWHLRFLKFLKI